MDAERLLKILEEGYEDSFLTPVYELKELPGVKASLASLVRRFHAEFPESHDVSIVRAPGRVNLLGEHTDYCGLPVLPMAVPREVWCCSSRRRDKKVLVRNIDPKYPAFEFTMRRRLPFSECGHWGNYVKAAFQGLSDHFVTSSGLPGLEMLFDGNIPTGAGLSSSSALVVATALAILSHSRKKVETLELAEAMAVAERYVGTQGGGMDQAASLLSEPGKALKIDFFPLRAEAVDLAKGYTILVCNSMVEAVKTGAAMQAYNGRALECRLATAVLSRIAGTDGAMRLGDLYRELGSAHLLRLIRSQLDEDPYSIEDVAGCLGIRPEEVWERFGVEGILAGETLSKKDYWLKARAVHVVSEAARVEDGAIIMRKGDAEGFGAVMNASHASCRNNFEVSCPELNVLTDVARENGALGARLTGAGFGGCTVNLVSQQNLEEVKSRILEAYYEDYLKRTRPELYERYKSGTEAVFEFRAAAGGRCLVA